MTRRLILLTTLTGERLARLTRAFGADVTIEVVNDLDALIVSRVDASTSLVSFGSGVIVPAEIIARFAKPSYNMHAGSPDFPGRDPHHHAIYRGATVYGATLHVMTVRVDEGPIVGSETFAVAPGTTPAQLLIQANEAGFRLVERFGPRLLDAAPLPALEGVAWGAVKTRRADLQRLCRMTPLITAQEFDRRFRAFNGPAYDNLTVELHGQTFRIDTRNPAPPIAAEAFGDFTEEGLRGLLRALRAGGYRFACYGQDSADRHVLWRHDVDFSMHRAARLAEIEAEEGAFATYFLNPRCTFYSLLEPKIACLIARIRGFGHELGLHFDAAAYSFASWTRSDLEGALARERSILETILDAPVRCVSWHNPDLSNLLAFDDAAIGGLVNAYGAGLRRNYAYCSDSNGYWRFQPMAEVIAAGHARLHLLTHPAWWTPDPMAPSARIDRAILGRARVVRRDYDAVLLRGGRRNVT